jgi:hypothetical protein
MDMFTQSLFNPPDKLSELRKERDVQEQPKPTTTPQPKK